MELIVATAGFDDSQGVVAVTGAGGTEAVNCVVGKPGKQILKLPLITGGKTSLFLFSVEENSELSFWSLLAISWGVANPICPNPLW